MNSRLNGSQSQPESCGEEKCISSIVVLGGWACSLINVDLPMEVAFVGFLAFVCYVNGTYKLVASKFVSGKGNILFFVPNR